MLARLEECLTSDLVAQASFETADSRKLRCTQRPPPDFHATGLRRGHGGDDTDAEAMAAAQMDADEDALDPEDGTGSTFTTFPSVRSSSVLQ